MLTRWLKTLENSKYVVAHPEAELGDPNFAHNRGFELVAIKPNGLMVYRRRSWWRH